MKFINPPIYALTMVLSLCSTITAESQTAERDTINREMVLERDFVPTAKQAQKAFFNPLQGIKSQALKPLDFARNTYEVSMNVRPHLFDPLENSHAIVPERNAWHLRLLGGYPVRYGANLGMLYRVGEQGSVELAVDHLSQSLGGVQRYSTYGPKNNTHDTSVGLKYSGKLGDRLVSIGVDVFNNMHTMYGLGETTLIGAVPETPSTNPLYRMTGAELHVELAPTPIALRSEWQYSLHGNVGYTNKQDIQLNGAGMIPSDPRHAISGMNLQVGGNLAYELMSYNVNLGVDALLSGNQLFGILLPYGTPASQYMSIDPYVSYVMDNFSIKAGARLQLLSFGPKKFIAAPKLQMKWDAHEMLAIIAEVDGGAATNSIRDLYRTNRYAQGVSTYFANDIAQYRASMGLQIGNLYGFTAELRGGYADYLSLYHWDAHMPYYAPRESSTPLYHTSTLTYFSAADRGRVKNIFVSASTRYISPIGLQASLGVKYNKYTRQIAEGDTEAGETRGVIAGRPSVELAGSLDYQITPRLSAHVSMTGLGGIKFVSPNLSSSGTTKATVSLPFIAEMSARLSYKIHRNIGLSLTGLNLLNQKSQRWLSYDRPGISVAGAMTLSF